MTNLMFSEKSEDAEIPTLEQLMNTKQIPIKVDYKRENRPMIVENTVEHVNLELSPPRVNS